MQCTNIAAVKVAEISETIRTEVDSTVTTPRVSVGAIVASAAAGSVSDSIHSVGMTEAAPVDMSAATHTATSVLAAAAVSDDENSSSTSSSSSSAVHPSSGPVAAVVDSGMDVVFFTFVPWWRVSGSVKLFVCLSVARYSTWMYATGVMLIMVWFVV